MRLAIFIIPFVLASLLLLSSKIGSAGIVKPVAVDVQERIAFHANQTGLPVDLVRAIAKVESNFNPLAKNPSDPSYGLMQITPALAFDYGVINDYLNPSRAEIEKIMDVDINLFVACRFLKHLSQYPFNQQIQSYNVGEWGYKKGARNLSYLEKVRGFYYEYSKRA